MPAASEPTLPRTWRPLGTRLAAAFFSAALILIITVAWLNFGQSIRDQFTLWQKTTVIGIGLLICGLNYALGRCRVTAREEGLVVVNGFRRHELDWAQVVAVRLPRGAPWATFDLNDGSTLAALGIQGTDAVRSRRAVRELRLLLAR